MLRLGSFALGLALYPFAVSGPPADTVRMVADHTDVRQEANAAGKTIGSAAKGSVFEVLGREGGWVRIAYPIGNGAFYMGYVPAVFCEDARGAAPTMTQTSLPVPPEGARQNAPPSRTSDSIVPLETANRPGMAAPPANSPTSQAAAPTASPPSITVYVGPYPSGPFVGTSKDILDSVQDLTNALRDDRSIRVVGTERAALVKLYVVDRRYEATGAITVGSGTANASGYYSGVATTIPTNVAVLRTVVRVGEYERPFAANSELRWKNCAKRIATDVAAWIKANRESIELNGRRTP